MLTGVSSPSDATGDRTMTQDDVQYLAEQVVSQVWDYIAVRPPKASNADVADALRKWLSAELELRGIAPPLTLRVKPCISNLILCLNCGRRHDGEC